jgi:diguanylate cyclase (GGDEF)-like protein
VQGTHGQAISGPTAPGRVPHGPFSVARALTGAGRLPDLDPLTGLVDRSWFDHAIGESEFRARRPAVAVGRASLGVQDSAPDFGIIALDLDDLGSINRREGREAGDGLLLLTAELLQEWSASDDMPARLGGDAFGILVRADAAHLDRAAESLRLLLARAPIPAILAAATPGRRGGLAGALRAAEHQVRAQRRSLDVRERDAERAVGSVRAAIAASTIHAQATGILMQWHGCSAQNARVELAYQAHELGLPVRALARLLIAVASGRALTEGEDAAGIELERAISLGARVVSRASATITDSRMPAARAPTRADGAYGLQSQPA